MTLFSSINFGFNNSEIWKWFFLMFIEYFNVKIYFFIVFIILIGFKRNFWWMIQILFILSFIFLFIIPYYFCWNGLGYLFGFDYISYGLILLRIWIRVLIIMASESVYRHGYFDNFFLFMVISLLLLLICTFRRLGIFSFYLFFEGRLIPTLFLILLCKSFLARHTMYLRTWFQ